MLRPYRHGANNVRNFGIAQASLEKAPKIDGVYWLARLQGLLLADEHVLRLTGFKGADLGRAAC